MHQNAPFLRIKYKFFLGRGPQTTFLATGLCSSSSYSRKDANSILSNVAPQAENSCVPWKLCSKNSVPLFDIDDARWCLADCEFYATRVPLHCMVLLLLLQLFYGSSGFCLGLPGWAGTRKVKRIWIYTHTHNRFTALMKYVWDHPGEQVPER